MLNNSLYNPPLRMTCMFQTWLTLPMYVSATGSAIFVGPDTHGTTFVASKFAIVSFLCALNAVSKK